MIKRLIQFFTRKNKTKVIQRSSTAITSFQKVIESLEKTKELASEIITKNIRSIEALQADNDELTDVLNKNEKIISNIEKILN